MIGHHETKPRPPTNTEGIPSIGDHIHIHIYTLEYIIISAFIKMENLSAQLNSLSPEQRQAVMMQAQQEANQSIMTNLMKEMVTTCFDKCSGTSVRTCVRARTIL